MVSKSKILNVFFTCLWVLAGVGLVFLLISAMQVKREKKCKGLEVNIDGVSNNFFIDAKDVEVIINRFAGGGTKGKPLNNFRLWEMENALKRNVWIKSAQIYFDNNDILKVDVEEREPIARVFAINDFTFYVDSSLAMLPLSEKFSARVPVFTGFPADTKVLSKKDSALLAGIRQLSLLIGGDNFLNALIEQVDITAERNFEMIPKIGNQLILFGDATNANQKFEKLKLFYKQVMSKAGWSRYNVIDLQYKDQVVARIRGKEDIIADSLKTMELMKFIAIRAAKEASDSLVRFAQDNDKNTTDSSLIQSSLQREEDGH
jgi:cell division protein FtsQ